MSVLSIDSLDFGYTKDRLLYRGFSLELNRGELISIVGKSGSGKSTLFELISGNLKPLKGSISCGSIAWVFQDPYSSFHPSYTIVEQIADVASLDGVDNIISDMGIEYSLIEKYPHQLSGGELQRCSILRALLMKPDIILCDEPTSALDNLIQLDVMKLILRYLDRVGILLITHDMDLAKWSSDTIINIEE
ncbi:ABC transporter-related protein [hydrothermal vent metagenome]|uniref:ABC transporter-related protein n=1 Tax=hydrothermal vent metagenome TaxID=652676 RepID=A0A1W1C2X8_9ZZZZ